jgi:hypothetical protein
MVKESPRLRRRRDLAHHPAVGAFSDPAMLPQYSKIRRSLRGRPVRRVRCGAERSRISPIRRLMSVNSVRMTAFAILRGGAAHAPLGRNLSLRPAGKAFVPAVHLYVSPVEQTKVQTDGLQGRHGRPGEPQRGQSRESRIVRLLCGEASSGRENQRKSLILSGIPNGTRTRVPALNGRCPNH